MFSDEHRSKLSKSHKGKKHSDETKQKISNSLKGNTNALGLSHSDETKQKMRESTIKRFARIKKDGKTNRKQVYALVCDGIKIKRSFFPKKLKEHPIYKRAIDLSRYKCFDCIYYVISNKCSVYEKCKFTPQSCIMFNFGQKICRSI